MKSDSNPVIYSRASADFFQHIEYLSLNLNVPQISGVVHIQPG